MKGGVRVVVVDGEGTVDALERAAGAHPRPFTFEHAPTTSAAIESVREVAEAGGNPTVVTEFVLDDDVVSDADDVPRTGGTVRNGDSARTGDDEGASAQARDSEPVRDGVDLVEHAKRAGAIRAVVHTSEGSESVAASSTVAGADAYVPKGRPDAQREVLDVLADGVASTDRTREKIETLHDVATDLEACETEREVFERTIEAAEQVLEFDQCLLDVRRGDQLIPEATSSGIPDGGAEATHVDAENVAARVARTQEATINNDLSEVTDADPAEMTYRSGFTVPVSDVGVFQAVSEELGAFTAGDLELAELLVAHVAESLKRVRNRQELQDERDRFAALFENVPDPAVRVSLDGHVDAPVVECANGAFAATFGFDPDGVDGTPLPEVVEPPDAEAADMLGSAHDGVEEVAREVRREAVDGVRDFVLHVIPVNAGSSDDEADGDEDGADEAGGGEDGADEAGEERAGATELYGIYTDITETKERERALERQNERLDEFASVVSHDLRNPLNVAEGHLVNYRQTGDEASLDEVSTAHDRMRDLIEDLLDLARSGDVVADTTVVDLEDAAQRAWASLHTPNATLVVEDSVRVVADAGRIVDVFANLFRNSVEHGSTGNRTQSGDSVEHGSSKPAVEDGVVAADDDPAVTIRLGVLEDGEGFFVADDGPGIPESEREVVFETGYTNAADGSGFGLAIVEQIVGAHGWSVSIVDAPDGGARFEFRDVEVAS